MVSIEEWKNLLRRKEDPQTDEEWDFEVLSEDIYEDEKFLLYKECVETYHLIDKETEKGVECGLEVFELFSIGNLLHREDYDDLYLFPYIESKGCPVTFKTWD